jgi:hypothetical protein
MKKCFLLTLCVFALWMLANCGIAPPIQELNVAKASLAKAQEAKAEEFAKEEYAKAQASLEEGEKSIVNKKNKKNKIAKQKLELAKADADAAYAKAAPAYAEYNIDLAKKQKLTAEEIKAQVAMKDKFAEAKKLLDAAAADKNAGKFEDSWDKSIKAKSLFEEIYRLTQEKKARAHNALKNADSSIKNAETENQE